MTLSAKKCGIICDPEVQKLELTQDSQILLLCSDGISEFIPSQEALQIASEFPPEESQKAADRICKEAWDQWIKEEGGAVVDDLTVIIAHLSCGPRLVLTIHGSGADTVRFVNIAGAEVALLSIDRSDDIVTLVENVASKVEVSNHQLHLVLPDGRCLWPSQESCVPWDDILCQKEESVNFISATASSSGPGRGIASTDDDSVSEASTEA